MNDTQKAAREALFQLKEATLKVLCEAREKGNGYLQPLEIRKRLGIPKAEEPSTYANTLIFGTLYYLETDKSVEHLKGQGWRIADETAELLSDTNGNYDHEEDAIT